MKIIHVGTALLLLVTCVLTWVTLCFTYTWFSLFDLSSIALDFFNGLITPEELRRTIVQNKYFMWEEVYHFQDVANILEITKPLTYVLSGICLPALVLQRKHLKQIGVISLSAYGFITIITASLFTFGGFRLLSKIFHSMLFENNTWAFNSQSPTRILYSADVMQLASIWVWSMTGLCITAIYILNKNKVKQQDVI